MTIDADWLTTAERSVGMLERGFQAGLLVSVVERNTRHILEDLGERMAMVKSELAWRTPNPRAAAVLNRLVSLLAEIHRGRPTAWARVLDDRCIPDV